MSTKLKVILAIAACGLLGGLVAAALTSFDKDWPSRLIAGPIAAVIAYGVASGLHGMPNPSISWDRLITYHGIGLSLLMGIGGADYCSRFLEIKSVKSALQDAKNQNVELENRVAEAKDQKLGLEKRVASFRKALEYAKITVPAAYHTITETYTDENGRQATRSVRVPDEDKEEIEKFLKSENIKKKKTTE